MNSSKSIIEKLSLAKYPTKAILHLPEDIYEFEGMDFDTTLQKEQYDLIFIFIFHLEDFKKHVQEVIEKKYLADKGYLYFAYPKKNNPQYSEYIDRDRILPAMSVDEEGFIEGSRIKFARMVSFNDVFTVIGLKAEPAKVKKAANSPKSQSVNDYIGHVEDIKKYLDDKKELLKIYNELTFGYQKDWARYVYSAKKIETQEKRLAEMETVLAEGYKTIELYKRAKK
ncbi:MAG TPA: YdeI/OmpD-associated family protein [Brevibacillus sp.]|nr:YdeI/OmpD-associated family protein [Brevibacillus sp.]